MSAFYRRDQWPVDELMGKLGPMTDAEVDQIAEYIFSHHHSGQIQDQIQLACREAAEQ